MLINPRTMSYYRDRKRNYFMDFERTTCEGCGSNCAAANILQVVANRNGVAAVRRLPEVTSMPSELYYDEDKGHTVCDNCA